MSEWFWDPIELKYSQNYVLSELTANPRDVFNARESASTVDDFALLASMLSGEDMFNLSMADDNARGYDGADVMYGFTGADVLRGDAGKDKLYGGTQNDVLAGGDGKDKLYGGNDNDILRGGDGKDVLRGGAGRDKILGGEGEDLFQFRTGDGKDIVKDFEASFLAHDHFDLSGLVSVVSWSDLKNNHMTQDGSSVVIDGGNGDLLILRHTDLDSLIKDYFEF